MTRHFVKTLQVFVRFRHKYLSLATIFFFFFIDEFAYVVVSGCFAGYYTCYNNRPAGVSYFLQLEIEGKQDKHIGNITE